MTDAHPALHRAVVLPVAEAIRDNLLRQGVAVRAEVAGSLRRGKHAVHDAEVVIELPTVEHQNLYGERRRIVPAGMFGRLDRALLENEWSQQPSRFTLEMAMQPFARRAWGERYRKLKATTGEDGTTFQVDLFIVHPPAQFAPIFAVRTGAATFGEEVVKRFHRYGMKLEEGRLIRKADGQTIDCPTEELYFAFAQLPCLPPEKRDLSIPETWELFKR